MQVNQRPAGKLWKINTIDIRGCRLDVFWRYYKNVSNLIFENSESVSGYHRIPMSVTSARRETLFSNITEHIKLCSVNWVHVNWAHLLSFFRKNIFFFGENCCFKIILCYLCLRYKFVSKILVRFPLLFFWLSFEIYTIDLYWSQSDNFFKACYSCLLGTVLQSITCFYVFLYAF